VVAFAGPHVAPRAPDEQLADGLSHSGLPRPPSPSYFLGTDALGRDELSRLLHGGQVSLQVALLSTTIAVALGLLLGLLAGYRGGLLDTLLMRIADGVLSLPFLLLAIAIHRVLTSGGVLTLCLLLGCFSWPVLARVTRGKVMRTRELDYVMAAHALGATSMRVLLRHVLPNVTGPALVVAAGLVAEMMLVESAMSFLGLGVPPPRASWGSMLHEAREMMPHAIHLLVAPATMIVLTVVGFHVLGEALRDALDPRG